MQRAKAVIEVALLALALCALVFLLFMMWRASVAFERDVVPRLDHLLSTVQSTADQAKQTATDLDRDTVILSGTLISIEKETRQWAADASIQTRNVNQVIATLNTDLTQMGTLISTANGSLSDQDAQLTSTERAANSSLTNLDARISQLDPILANLQRTSLALADNAADPHIKDLLAQTDGIATDAHTETGLIVGATRKALTPKNKFIAIMQMLSSGTINAAEFYYYLSH